MRGDAAIQFAPVEFKPKPPPETPAWLKAIGEFLQSLFEPLGKALGMSWPVMQWLLIGIGVICVLLILWRLLAPLLAERRRKVEAEEVPTWTPGQAAAAALLEDADRLAGEGRYDEAAHLLLTRSVGQIAAARPQWLGPASTAREIASLPELPTRARNAFALIAKRVERSLFALIPLDAGDWQAARTAYADFALAEIVETAR